MCTLILLASEHNLYQSPKEINFHGKNKRIADHGNYQTFLASLFFFGVSAFFGETSTSSGMPGPLTSSISETDENPDALAVWMRIPVGLWPLFFLPSNEVMKKIHRWLYLSSNSNQPAATAITFASTLWAVPIIQYRCILSLLPVPFDTFKKNQQTTNNNIKAN